MSDICKLNWAKVSLVQKASEGTSSLATNHNVYVKSSV